MKKLNLLILILISSFLTTTASNWVGISNNNPENAKITLVSSDISNNIVKFSLDGYFKNEVTTSNGKAFTITIGEGTYILEKNAPDLSKLTASILIPDKGSNTIEVISSKYTDYNNINIAPSKGNLTRDIDPASVPYLYGNVYQKNEFFPGKLADLKEPYIIRDYRGQTIVVYPFQYNPVTKVLRVYTEIIVKVTNNEKTAGLNEFNRKSAPQVIDADYANIYKHQFINFGNQKYTPLGEQGKMLILCYGSFMSAMQPFVDWKNTIGIPTVMVDVATAGSTATAIKTYVQNYYNTNGLTYLLLVGDAAQIPTFTVSGGGSDNSYGYFTGNDHYQEIFVGRFSAENTTHVTTQVNRSISYELTPSTVSDKFNKVIGIASDQGPGDDNEYDYQHNRNINTDLTAFTYITPTIELYDGSQGGNDASGDPTPTMVGNEINNGAGIINYTGHGSDNSWGTSGFSNTNITNLTNTAVQPFIWSVACVNGNFVSGTCFAEGWLRATYNGQPSGSVATFMSTINQSWNPPMEGQDEMNDILCEHYPTNIKRTFGGLSINGCFKMNDTYSDFAMTDTWTIFGDPSLMVRTANPGTLSVIHNPNAIVGATQFVVNCTTENAFVSLTINNQIIGTGTVTGGSATISFPALATVGSLKIAVTAFNKIPYIQTIPIIAPSSPFIVLNTYTTTASPDFGQAIGLNVTLENVAGSPYNASNVVATLTTSNPNITITDNTENYGTINAGATSLKNNAFGITIANNVPDQTNVSFNIHSTGSYNTNNYTWDSPLNLVVNAPIMTIGNMTISDPTPGNGNGRLDPGETVTITIQNSNTGHANCTGAIGTLTESSPYVTITTGTFNIGNINAGASSNSTYTVTADAAAPIGTVVDFGYDLTSGQYNATKSFGQAIGMIFEDWETNTFTKFPWINAAPSWTLAGSGAQYEGLYCAKSATISHSGSTSLYINYNVTSNDSIKFYKKVSSESNYDYLKFYIGTTEIGSWSGTSDVWSLVKYPVTAGTKVFKWEYSKDGSVSSGSDCAWIDYIVFPAGYAEPGVGIENFVSDNKVDLNCYPNPSSNQTTLSYSLNKSSNVLLTVYNAYGETVNVLVNNTKQNEGLHNIVLNVNNLSAGVYYCVLKTDNNLITKRITVTK